MIESLESRIAPAILLNPHTVSYTDVDGDKVLVSTTKGTWDLARNFVFSKAGDGEHLDQIDLKVDRQFAGASLSIVATGRGDGYADVGAIYGDFLDLAKVIVDGNLGLIRAGDFVAATTGLAELNVHTMGKNDATTGAFGVLDTSVTGKLGKLIVAGDVTGEGVYATSIGSVKIGGSLSGGGLSHGGTLSAQDDIGAVTIAGNVVGDRASSARIESSAGSIGTVKIGGDVSGGLVPGDGSGSGAIVANRNIGAVTIGGNLNGGLEPDSGVITATLGKIQSVVLGGAIDGGSGANGGRISASGSIGLIQTGTKTDGSIFGGGSPNSGSISAGSIARMIVHGDLLGGSGENTGAIFAYSGRLGFLSISGSVVGESSGANSISSSGCIDAVDIGTIKIGGDLHSGSQLGAGSIRDSGAIHSQYAIGSITVGKNIIGGVSNPCLITADGAIQPTAKSDLTIGSITVGGDILNARILAGYYTSGNPHNGDAQIGTITVKHNVRSTSIVAGVDPGDDPNYGDSHDAVIASGARTPGLFSCIGSIVIGGVVEGTPSLVDGFGFVAEQIGAVKIGGKALALKAGPNNDRSRIEIAEFNNDVFVLEV